MRRMMAGEAVAEGEGVVGEEVEGVAGADILRVHRQRKRRRRLRRLRLRRRRNSTCT